MSPPNPVCVLGVARSGTSLLARAADMLGVHFGREEAMLRPNSLNPRGFWELPDIGALNDDVLASWGGPFLEPPHLTPGWERGSDMAPFRLRVEEIVERHFAGRGRWGFKHSGTSLTLPLWRSVVGEFDYVICVRNPLEVRASGRVARPVLMGDPEAAAPEWGLWAYCYAQILRNTVGRRRAFVFYDEWLVDPRAVVDRLAGFLGAEEGSAQAQGRVVEIVESGLHRHRASERELAEATHVPAEVRALYFLLQDLAAAEAQGDERAEALQAVAVALDGQRVQPRGSAAAP